MFIASYIVCGCVWLFTNNNQEYMFDTIRDRSILLLFLPFFSLGILFLTYHTQEFAQSYIASYLTVTSYTLYTYLNCICTS